MANARHIKVGPDGGDVRGSDNLAIQIAVDALRGVGGTVELLPGVYECMDAVHMRSGVSLVGAGEKTVLRRADGFRVAMEIDADYAQQKITPVDITPFKVGQGLYVQDERSHGWLDSIVTVRRIEDGAIHFDEYLSIDYSEERGGEVLASGALIFGIDVQDAAVEGLVVDGNREYNFQVGGCWCGGIYFHKSSRVTLRDVAVKNFHGDGISFQTTRDFLLERVSSRGCSNFGVHPGTGSARVIMKDCNWSGNDVGGYFLCWRVQEGRFENLVCEGNGGFGVNIGHKDSDNVFVNCDFSRNGKVGILFREENLKNGGHRNRFENCIVEDNDGVGIEVQGHVEDVVFEDTTVRDTRGAGAKQRVGLLLGEHARRFSMKGSTWGPHAEEDVRDLSGPQGCHEIDA